MAKKKEALEPARVKKEPEVSKSAQVREEDSDDYAVWLVAHRGTVSSELDLEF